MNITISDVTCSDCKGPVTLFLIPDKVWSGLGLTTEWVCLPCVAHRLNPAITVEDLSTEMYRQRRTFKLKRINKYGGERFPTMQLVIAKVIPGGPSEFKAVEISGPEADSCKFKAVFQEGRK